MTGGLVNTQQLHVENQSGIWRNEAWETSWTVGLVAWDGQLSLGTNRQLWNTNVPALDHLTNANGTLERLTSVTGRVELLTVFQSTGVVDGDGVADVWEDLTIAFLDSFDFGGFRSHCDEGGRKLSATSS